MKWTPLVACVLMVCMLVSFCAPAMADEFFEGVVLITFMLLVVNHGQQYLAAPLSEPTLISQPDSRLRFTLGGLGGDRVLGEGLPLQPLVSYDLRTEPTSRCAMYLGPSSPSPSGQGWEARAVRTFSF